MPDIVASKDDKKWLESTHLKNRPLPEYEIAYVYGNEDCPKMIELYKINHHLSKPMVFMLQDHGGYMLTNYGDYPKDEC